MGSQVLSNVSGILRLNFTKKLAFSFFLVLSSTRTQLLALCFGRCQSDDTLLVEKFDFVTLCRCFLNIRIMLYVYHDFCSIEAGYCFVSSKLCLLWCRGSFGCDLKGNLRCAQSLGCYRVSCCLKVARLRKISRSSQSIMLLS